MGNTIIFREIYFIVYFGKKRCNFPALFFYSIPNYTKQFQKQSNKSLFLTGNFSTK